MSGKTYRIEVCDPIPADLYDKIAGFSGANIYHTEAWHRVLSESCGWSVSAAVAWSGTDVVGFLPFVRKRRLARRIAICLPLSHRVGPLGDGIDQMLASIGQIEVHEAVPGIETSEVGNLVETRLQMADVGSTDDLKQKLKKNIRRDVGIAKKSGCTMRVGIERKDFETFAALQTVTRKRQGSPDYPADFFPAMARHLASKGLARVHLCELDGESVAGILVLADPDGRTAYYGYGASVADKTIWRKGVNQLALWDAIRVSFEHGAATFSFGSTPAAQKPLWQYKERFGGVTEPLPMTKVGSKAVEIEHDGVLAKIGTPVLKAMPLGIFRRFSPFLLREVL